TGRKQDKMALAMGEEQRKALAKLKAMAEEAKKNADYVGDKFAEEARKIHFGEVEPRGIYGEASAEEARGLVEDGVEFVPLPTFPADLTWFGSAAPPPPTCLPASPPRNRGGAGWPGSCRLSLLPVHGEKVPGGRMRGSANACRLSYCRVFSASTM